MTRNSISRYILRSAGEVKRFRVLMRVIPIVIAILVALASVVYVSSVMYNRYGSYTVTVNKFDNLNYSISLSEFMIEDPDNPGKIIPGKPVARLNSKASEQIHDMDGADLPADIDMIDGEHNGENYIAYTYYLVNNGEKTLTYEYNLYIVNIYIVRCACERTDCQILTVFQIFCFEHGLAKNPGRSNRRKGILWIKIFRIIRITHNTGKHLVVT